MTEGTGYKLRAGFAGPHATITESTTGIVACGQTWCDGSCGLPALVLQHEGVEYKARGEAVAVGRVFQPWPRSWAGSKVQATLGPATIEQALRMMWW